jgi:hypothetical protein
MNTTTLNALATFPTLLGEHFALFPVHQRHWAPASWEGVPSESLTAIEQLCHVRDIEIDGYQRRIERTLSEENPFLEAIDTDALAKERRYSEADFNAVLASFKEARARTVALLGKVRPEQFDRRAEFEDYGPVTLRGLVHFLCSHDQQHVAGLQWLLGKLNA